MNHIDENILIGLKDVMEDDFSLLIETFLQDTEDRIAQIANLAISAVDPDQIRRAAHSLKGSSSNVGAIGMVTLCAVLEAKALADDLDRVVQDVADIEQEFIITKKLMQQILSAA
jgi:HPt (histidine-containing phosphotransfer) domain-containing protein